ncbi:hypothetical protein [Pleurocapsa sp. FMAR1]|uniref:hypothetical protein n=1 Tax=Pleurocapsa sp. FMAR1 TaxID=3040204 RepID=UPI0029C831EB|nr:hypothetical protein [Pleurocapsa sp. FMAR1]
MLSIAGFDSVSSKGMGMMRGGGVAESESAATAAIVQLPDASSLRCIRDARFPMSTCSPLNMPHSIFFRVFVPSSPLFL